MDRSEIAAMKAELRRMQARVEQLEGEAEEPVNRRNMLRGLGAAAAGAAVGGLAFARPAAAVDGATLIIGNETQTAQTPTALVASSYTTGTNDWGVFHVTNDATVENSNALLSCISVYADSAQTGGLSTGIFSSSVDTGAKLDAPVPLKISDATGSGPPSSTFGRTGQFRVDNGDLWFCTYDDGLFGGDNPRWRKLAGPTSAGTFHAVTPSRVYDSRLANPAGGVGAISVGQNRIVSVKDKRSNGDGTVVQANFVPAGATAVTANVTVTNTNGGFGYLAINPGNVLTEGASTINWSATGQTLANGVVLTLDSSRQLNVICNGVPGNSTHFIIDVSGYFL